ncbi:hypothetical protein DXG01_002444 [Tephrocybe rancida]|nr:hypothetical protein DXG01_002444 [Tephrocybe rancida]
MDGSYSVYPDWQQQQRMTTVQLFADGRAEHMDCHDHHSQSHYPSPALSSASPTYNALHSYPTMLDYTQQQIEPTTGPARNTRAQKVRPYPHPQDRHGRPTLNVAPPQSYDPMTPTSTPSPYHRPSIPSHHRAPSPALSCVSALTSVSSSAPHQQPPHTTTTPFPSSSTPTAPSYHPTASPSPKPKQKKQRLDNLDRKRICRFHADHPGARQEDIASEFGVERSTISKILKQKARWLAAPDAPGDRAAKHRPSKFPEIEEELLKWLSTLPPSSSSLSSTPNPIGVSDTAIRTRAKAIARALHVPEEKFKASSGWVDNFKARAGVKGGLWSGVPAVAVPSSSAVNAGTGSAETEPAKARLIEGAGAAGAGAGLSPLNPAFRTGMEGLEEEEEEEEEGASPYAHASPTHTHTPHLTGPAQAYLPPQVPPQTQTQPQHSPLSLSPTHSHPATHSPLSALSAHTHHTHTHTHSLSPTSAHSLSHSHHTTATTHPEEQVLFRRAPQHIPSLAEAEGALDTLLLFLDVRARVGLVSDAERDALQAVKGKLFEEAVGGGF